MLNNLLRDLCELGVVIQNVDRLGSGTCPDFQEIKELKSAKSWAIPRFFVGLVVENIACEKSDYVCRVNP